MDRSAGLILRLGAAALLAASSASGQPAPADGTLRIGLADPAPAARVSAARPFVLRAGALEIEVSEALIVPETVGSGESALALGSFFDEAGASEAATRFEEGGSDRPAVRVIRNPSNGRFLAVLAAGADAFDAGSLRALGFPGAGAFRLRSPTGDALLVHPLGGAPIRIAGVALVGAPPDGAFLEWDGAPYRGELEFTRAGNGVRVVNRLPLEDYLLGVIPRELPPELFPEVEALKAQALAARTYALIPRPAYLERGYDLCSGPACQVYGGVAAEHPLSTRAVRETEGQVILFEGRFIDALYTAACGGSTENAENVFTTPTPYLVARACRREAGGAMWTARETLALDAGIARLGGTLPPGWGADASWSAPTADEVVRVFGGALDWMGFERCDPAPADSETMTLGRLAVLLEELRCRPSGGSLAGPAPEGAAFAPGGPPALGRLLAEGLLDPGDRGLEPARGVTAREVVSAAAALLRLDGRLLRRAQVRQAGPGGVIVEPEVLFGDPAVPHRLEPGPDALLYREVRPTRIPGREARPPVIVGAAEVRLRPGDFVRYRPLPPAPDAPPVGEGAPVATDLLILEDLGETLDRFSAQASWLVPKNNADLSARIERLEGRPLGRITALEPLAFGPSGRVTRLLIRGTAGEIELSRFSIRSRLGLSENLFFAEARRDPGGGVTEWWFHGRGWGHGLGLCQAGAYGMAAEGGTYREILAYYYPGTTIEVR